MGLARCVVLALVAVAAVGPVRGTPPPHGACAFNSTGCAEDFEESGLLQQRTARHQQPQNCTPLQEGEPCIAATPYCVGQGAVSCPCGPLLKCKRMQGCSGKCLRDDKQLCTSNEQCAGGNCAGNMDSKGGHCRERTGAFTINLIDISGGIVDENPQFKEAFEKAAARYAEFIKGQTILWDDVVVDIEYSVEPIDGPSNILGYAGPTYVSGAYERPYGIRWLPVAGIMVFDIDDLLGDFAAFAEVIILHEMGHVLGLGSLQELSPWFGPPTYDVTDCEKSGGVDGRYNSLDGYATAAYLCSGGYIPTDPNPAKDFTRARTPPMETIPMPGTQCGHWDEGILNNELMTGFLNTGSNPLSIITIGGFEDLGYMVDYSVADPYTVPSPLASLSALQVRAGNASYPGLNVDNLIIHPTLGHGVADTSGERHLDTADRAAGKAATTKGYEAFKARYAKTAVPQKKP